MTDFLIKYDAEIIAFLVFGAVVLLGFVFIGKLGRRSTNADQKDSGTRAYLTGINAEEREEDE